MTAKDTSILSVPVILLIVAVSFLMSVFLTYLFHEELSSYVMPVIIGRFLGFFIGLTLIEWLIMKRRAKKI